MESAGYLTAFVFGALSFLSPCVLPLLPGYLGLMSGYSVAELQQGSASIGRMFRVTLMFVAGLSIVFVALGAGATSVAGLLARNRSTITVVAGWMIVIFGLLILIMALSTSPRLAFLYRERRVHVRPSSIGFWAPMVMGLAFGFGWTPCIGPVLAAILTQAATQETVLAGMSQLFVFSMGMGIPFIAAGIGVTKLYSGIKLLQRHLRTINVLSGLLMVVFGWMFITGRITDLSGLISDWLIWLGLERLAEI
ncbi:MAG: cytochrome c biogenesis protein CcdA [bacterium]|nr:cytochrome c biogenesis protein CcdA [bacterium]